MCYVSFNWVFLFIFYQCRFVHSTVIYFIDIKSYDILIIYFIFSHKICVYSAYMFCGNNFLKENVALYVYKYMFNGMLFIVYLNVQFVQSETCTLCHKWYQFLIINYCILNAYSEFFLTKNEKKKCTAEALLYKRKNDYCKCYLS